VTDTREALRKLIIGDGETRIDSYEAADRIIAAGWPLPETDAWWREVFSAPASPDAVRAQALEEAAQELERRAGNIDGHPEKARVLLQAAGFVRALSPLTPGSRVVVIPPEGGLPREEMAARLKRAILAADFDEIGDAAMRALTREEKT
jgi:hypothetical protein